jgi:hypothetical protein
VVLEVEVGVEVGRGREEENAPPSALSNAGSEDLLNDVTAS